MTIIPKNEAELIFRFAQEMPEAWELLCLRAAFPDAELRIDGKVYRVEFEYRSVGFVQHRHDLTKADLVICWIHDWGECPLPVLEVSKPDWPGTTLFEVSLQARARASVKQLRHANRPGRLQRAQKDLGIAKAEKARASTRETTVKERVWQIEANLRAAEEREAEMILQQFKQARLEDPIKAAEADQTLEPGDLVSHSQYHDFRGRVILVDNGRCKVEILDGWKGPSPTWPVTIPTSRLVRLNGR